MKLECDDTISLLRILAIPDEEGFSFEKLIDPTTTKLLVIEDNEKEIRLSIQIKYK